MDITSIYSIRNRNIMNEITDNFAWIRQLECPPAVYNDTVKKILCKGVLELFWEDIAKSTFPMAEASRIRKNILLYKMKHGLDDTAFATVRDLSQLRSKSNTLKHQISMLEMEYEEQDYTVRRKMEELKGIRNRCSTIGTRKEFLKLKHSETSNQLKDCDDMRRVCQHFMPNTSREINQQRVKESLDIVAGLRSTENKKQIRREISASLGGIETHTLWTYLYQTLSQNLNGLMEAEIKNDLNGSATVGENIDIGIGRACGQYIYIISKRALSNAKAEKYQQRLIDFIELIESLSQEDISCWLALTLEIKKLEVEQECLQNELRTLKDNIQDNSLLNLDIAQLTADIEAIDAQMDEYVKNIQQSISVLNSAAPFIHKAKEKLHYELQRIVALQAENYDSKLLNNSLDIELDMFHGILDLDALRKVMLKGDVRAYRHAICAFSQASVATVNPYCSRIKSYFPIIQTPIYSLIECYKNITANMIYTKLHQSTRTTDVECADKLVPLREKCSYNTLELLNLSRLVHKQVQEEIECFNRILNSWTMQDVQEAMVLDERTVDDAPFKDWLQRYNLLLYMIQNAK